MMMVITCSLYVAISIALIVWLARKLSKHGRLVVIESSRGNEAVADSVVHLLTVGFCLVNTGYVSLTLRFAEWPTDIADAIAGLGTKVGFELIVLGLTHFLSIRLIARFWHRAQIRTAEAAFAAGTTPVTASSQH